MQIVRSRRKNGSSDLQQTERKAISGTGQLNNEGVKEAHADGLAGFQVRKCASMIVQVNDKPKCRGHKQSIWKRGSPTSPKRSPTSTITV